MEDPWKHRSLGMVCATCMWFVPKYGDAPLQVGEPDLGRCRRHAPTMSGYPAVFETDWCGDHKLNENKRSYDYGLRVPAERQTASEQMAPKGCSKCGCPYP